MKAKAMAIDARMGAVTEVDEREAYPQSNL